MNDEYVYLSYYQVMAYVHSLMCFKSCNIHFNDELCNNFENYVVKRSREILETDQISKLLIPRSTKYKVSKSMVVYLERMTGIDVFDKKVMEDYKHLYGDLEKSMQGSHFTGYSKKKNKKS